MAPRTFNDFLLQKEGAGAQGFIQNLLNAVGSIATPATAEGVAWASCTAFTPKKSIVGLGGRLFRTTVLIDLTGLDSVNTADDVIGKSTGTAFLHKYLANESGTCVAAAARVSEAPATGDADLDVFSSTASTYVLGDGSAGLAGYAKLLDGDTLAINDFLSFTGLPANGAYIGLASGTGAAATYTAGVIELTFLGIL